MRKLTVIAAGLGWRLLERRKATVIAGIRFEPRPSVFPAVTCVAQATLRTGLAPVEHGMLSNGVWLDDLQKPAFWEQSCRFVKGARVWGRNSGVFFFQQSLGEDVDLILSPAPIHKHGGGMVMSCYTKPTGMAEPLRRQCGTFPLWRYWGPLASPNVGRKCIDWFKAMTDAHDVEEGWLYLPTLDYAAQKHGPDSQQDMAAFAEFVRQIERLADLCEKRGCSLSVIGDYEITPVTAPPVRPNVTLRKAGLFRTRTVAGMVYPDFYQSTAFALCDHEFCLLYGPEAAKARDLLLSTSGYEEATLNSGGARLPANPDSGGARPPANPDSGGARPPANPDSGGARPPANPDSGGARPLANPDSGGARPLAAHILLARQGSWCEYKWWTDRREAPDYASHVDIHNKPGYDPAELFLFGRGTVRGTHGRKCEVAHAQA